MSRKQNSHYYSLQAFFRYMRLYRWRFLLVMSVFVISSMALAVVPIFIGRLIADLAADPVRGHSAITNTWVLIGLSAFHDISWHIGEFLFMRLINPLSYHYETLLFRRIIRQPYPYFVNKFTGKISSYVTTISQEMRSFFDNIIYNYTTQIVNLVVIIVILINVNWQTGAVFCSGLIIMFIAGRLAIRNSTFYEKLSTDVQSTKNAKIIDAIANFVNVKSFQREASEIKTISAEQEKSVKAATKSYGWSLFFWTVMSFCVRDLIWPLTIGLNVYLFLHGQISLAELSTVLSTILIFSATIWELVWHVSQFNLKVARIEEAHRYLFGTSKISVLPDKAAGKMRVPNFTQDFTIDNLTFAYPDKPERAVLHNISLTLRHGEKIGIVGHSGSGKTTLTKLLLDYYPTHDPALLIDGRKISSDQLSKLISFVPQDTSLFHRTIAENIAYAAEREVTREEIIDAAKRAYADDFINLIDEGYEALVGERGVKLSAGQRQRIAIARALLDDKPILIMDEATSALDTESELLVQRALEALWEDKTVIAIAHRLSTLRHMDRIIVMDDGRIIESGSHDQLLKAGGAYARLWSHQTDGFIVE